MTRGRSKLTRMIATLSLCATLLVAPSYADEIDIRALSLPPSMGIALEGERVEMRANGRLVIATVLDANDVARVVLWDRDGKPMFLEIPPPTPHPGGFGVEEYAGPIASDGTIYGNVGRDFSGGYSGTRFEIATYRDRKRTLLSVKPCDADGEPHAETVGDDGLGITFESTDLITNLDDTERYAPYAAFLVGDRCRIIGRANLRAERGRYAVGFRGYFGKMLAPTNVNTASQRYVAVRWTGSSLSELGPGVALDVASDGVAVGADGPSDIYSKVSVSVSGPAGNSSHVLKCCSPHAVLWNRAGARIYLAKSFPHSVAYAIDDAHRVVGTLQDSKGQQYAFVWQHGTLRRLDDVIKMPGWRFESAYAFTPDGGIVGIGRRHGIATAFVAHL